MEWYCQNVIRVTICQKNLATPNRGNQELYSIYWHTPLRLKMVADYCLLVVFESKFDWLE